jgi:hypothetical protein
MEYKFLRDPLQGARADDFRVSESTFDVGIVPHRNGSSQEWLLTKHQALPMLLKVQLQMEWLRTKMVAHRNEHSHVNQK